MPGSGISEDICRCGHVASAHHDGAGECLTCKGDKRVGWSILTRCQRFDWAAMWETEKTA